MAAAAAHVGAEAPVCPGRAELASPSTGSARCSSTSSAAAPKSPNFRYAAVNSASLLPDNSPTTRHSDRPPTCSVASSHAGKGLPDRNTAETDASSTGRDLRYAATIRIFSSFLVVAAIASQVSANCLMMSIPLAAGLPACGGRRSCLPKPRDSACLLLTATSNSTSHCRASCPNPHKHNYLSLLRLPGSHSPVIPLALLLRPPKYHLTGSGHELSAQNVAFSGGLAASAGARER